MIDFYFYSGQLRRYLLQVCAIFTGLQIQTGKGVNGEVERMNVPIVIGSRDRVAAAINAGNTQNKPFAVPIMAASISAINLPAQRKGIGTVDSRTFLPEGGVYPTDLKVLKRVMPIPYLMSVDVGLYASNTDQLHQILEQILMIFDPVIQIQTSESAFDWTKITHVELTGINNEENYPAGNDRRVINWTLSFEVPIYIAGPADMRDDIVERIMIQLGDLEGFSVNEVDENGDLQPFSTTYGGIIEITR